MKLLLSTHNLNKLKEFKSILKDQSIELLSLQDFKDNDDVEETGNTFRENAFIKAKYAYDKYHIPSIADDSGLCVNALNGLPGINSSRFSGKGSEANIDKLLSLLKNEENRSAYFICVICLYDGKNSYYFEGRCEGNIARKRVGYNGFGYDPIFMIDNYDSFATIPEELKNKISHRFLAINELNKFLNK